MIFPSKDAYGVLAQEYNLIPVYTEMIVDMDTPISIYNKACPGEPGFLLESVEGGEKLARYSFIGFQPMVIFDSKDGVVRIIEAENCRRAKGSPFNELEVLMKRFKAPRIAELPRFYGGAVGYFGYDTIRYIEDLPDYTAEILGLPDCQFMITKFVLIFDHVKHKLKIVCNTQPGQNPEKDYRQALRDIENIKEKIYGTDRLPVVEASVGVSQVQSNMTKEEFIQKVLRAKEYIKAGDVFQVVLSQRFSTPLAKEPFQLYRSLRVINPAPYLYYLDFGETKIIGSSPEMLIRVEDGIVETCPIAGTRPRGRTKEEDVKLEKELLQDAKEKAEHLMLVDLGRNDLGRVCKCGSIEVPEFMVVEKYSHVMHLVSTVKGQLEEGKTIFDALKACFPAGTLSGAPKIRAMEIIEELEPDKRGIYGGAIGYLGFTGNMDTCITIRTILVHQGHTYIQSGAGIVADSDPELEYQETINKAKALIETIMLKEVV